MSVRAGILVTGTEVLTARIVDRNGPWISQRLDEIGVEVSHIICVGDRPADLSAALHFLESEGVDLIVTSGGLGPTADDLTGEIVGSFAERELVLDEAMEERIGEILRGFAKRMNFDVEALMEANRKQAMVPRGAIAINPAGTAPGLVVPARELVVIVLPGPPRELHAMWDAALETEPVKAILARTRPFGGVTLRALGIPESEIAKSLREIEEGGEADLSRLEIVTCLRRSELEIEVRHDQADVAECERLVAAIERRHGRFIFSRDGSTIDDQVAELLAGHRIGLGESCSGGLLATRLTERPGASDYFAGGVVAYSNEAKVDLLGVSEATLREHGAVSVETAKELADGALERFGADLGVGITGIAGPDGGTEEKPVGYVCVSAVDSSGRRIDRDITLPGSRADIRDRSVVIAMHMIRRLLRGEEMVP